jgi:hypothetical protein
MVGNFHNINMLFLPIVKGKQLITLLWLEWVMIIGNYKIHGVVNGDKEVISE